METFTLKYRDERNDLELVVTAPDTPTEETVKVIVTDKCNGQTFEAFVQAREVADVLHWLMVGKKMPEWRPDVVERVLEAATLRGLIREVNEGLLGMPRQYEVEKMIGVKEHAHRTWWELTVEDFMAAVKPDDKIALLTFEEYNSGKFLHTLKYWSASALGLSLFGEQRHVAYRYEDEAKNPH